MLEKTNLREEHFSDDLRDQNKFTPQNLPEKNNNVNLEPDFSRFLSEVVGKTIYICGIIEGKYISVEILSVDGKYIRGITVKDRQEIYISIASIVFLIRNTPESRKRYFSRFGGGDFAMKITSNSFIQYC